jgi:hypothetical protein
MMMLTDGKGQKSKLVGNDDEGGPAPVPVIAYVSHLQSAHIFARDWLRLHLLHFMPLAVTRSDLDRDHIRLPKCFISQACNLQPAAGAGGTGKEGQGSACRPGTSNVCGAVFCLRLLAHDCSLPHLHLTARACSLSSRAQTVMGFTLHGQPGSVPMCARANHNYIRLSPILKFVVVVDDPLSVLVRDSRPKPTWHPKWKLMRVISGHLGWVRCLAVEPQNQWFCTGSADRTIKIWDMASGGLKLTLTGHISALRGLAVSDRHPYVSPFCTLFYSPSLISSTCLSRFPSVSSCARVAVRWILASFRGFYVRHSGIIGAFWHQWRI